MRQGRRTAFAVALTSLLISSPASPTGTAAVPLRTDANLVTALDVSDSIMRHEEWIEFDGIAKALVHPAFVNAIETGYHGRIGFTVFTWSSDGNLRVIVPWTVIASAADAERVADMLRRAPRIDRSAWAGSDQHEVSVPTSPNLLTDISDAIEFATKLTTAAPYEADRAIINICGNGADNVGEGPQAARDRAVASGIIVNGVVIGSQPAIADYFRENVQGGLGSFVLEAKEPGTVVDAMLAKFLKDLAVGRRPPAPAAAI